MIMITHTPSCLSLHHNHDHPRPTPLVTPQSKSHEKQAGNCTCDVTHRRNFRRSGRMTWNFWAWIKLSSITRIAISTSSSRTKSRRCILALGGRRRSRAKEENGGGGRCIFTRVSIESWIAFAPHYAIYKQTIQPRIVYRVVNTGW